MKRLVSLAVVMSCVASAAIAGDAVSFKDQQIVMVIGTPPGGGTDVSGRLVAQFISRHLPGEPKIVVRNHPGVDGLIALNYMVQQTRPDGLTVVMGSASNVNPINYRNNQAVYDPTTFKFLGGVGRGGTAMIISKAAEARLHDKSQAPVVMGSIGGVPRTGMQVTAWGIEYLGWNAKWVVGYRGTNDVMLALERGEIDMTATANMFQVDKFIENGNFSLINQSGTLENGQIVSRPEYASVPIFSDLIEGKITDPIAQKAFDYWQSVNSVDKWLAVIGGTPEPIVTTYREAFKVMGADPEFIKQGKTISEDFAPMSYQDVEHLVMTLSNTPQPAITYVSSLMRKQGLNVPD